MYDDNVPYDVVDLEVPPSDDQIGGDVIDAAQRIRFSVKKATLRYNKDRDVASLSIQSRVGALGVDGNGKYTNKILFGEMIVWSDPETKTSDWWKKQARFPWKQFQGAIGLDAASATKINDSFLLGLEGKEFIADIKKSEMKEKGEDGKYVGTGDFKNELANYKKAE